MATAIPWDHTALNEDAPVLLLFATPAAWGQNAGPGRDVRFRRASDSASPASRLLQALIHATAPDQAVRDVYTIWETDRRS